MKPIKKIFYYLFPGRTLGVARSGKWKTVRKHFLITHPQCAVCQTKKKLQVHHIIPFHVNPELELDPKNLIVLCKKRKHHILFGHLGSFHSYNENVKEDATTWRNKITNRP